MTGLKTGIPGLESDDLGPTELLKVQTELRGGVWHDGVSHSVLETWKITQLVLTPQTDIVVVAEPANGIQLTTNVELARRVVKVADSRVFVVTSENFQRLLRPIRHN